MSSWPLPKIHERSLSSSQSRRELDWQTEMTIVTTRSMPNNRNRYVILPFHWRSNESMDTQRAKWCKSLDFYTTKHLPHKSGETLGGSVIWFGSYDRETLRSTITREKKHKRTFTKQLILVSIQHVYNGKQDLPKICGPQLRNHNLLCFTLVKIYVQAWSTQTDQVKDEMLSIKRKRKTAPFLQAGQFEVALWNIFSFCEMSLSLTMERLFNKIVRKFAYVHKSRWLSCTSGKLARGTWPA